MLQIKSISFNWPEIKFNFIFQCQASGLKPNNLVSTKILPTFRAVSAATVICADTLLFFLAGEQRRSQEGWEVAPKRRVTNRNRRRNLQTKRLHPKI